MSSRKVSDILSLDQGITLIEKGEVTRGATLAQTGKHMSIKEFNFKFGDDDYESRREAAIDTYHRGQDLKRDIELDKVQTNLKREDSALYLETEIYI